MAVNENDGTFTQNAWDFYEYITPKYVYQAWNEIDGIDKNDDDAAWQRKITEIAHSYRYNCRFALARYIDEHIVEGEVTGKLPKKLAVKTDTPKTYEQAIAFALTGLQQKKYKEWLKNKADSRRGSENPEEQANIDEENARIIKLAWDMNAAESRLFKERGDERPKTRLVRDDAIKLGHALGFNVKEMNEFLLRVFELDNVLRWQASDVVDMFVFMTNASWWEAEKLKKEYPEEKEKLKNAGLLSQKQASSAICQEGTRTMMSKFVDRWEGADFDRERDNFLHWLVTEGPDEDRTSRTATAIYRNLAVYAWKHCVYEVSGENLKAYLKILPGHTVETDLTCCALMEDGIPSREKCKNVAGRLLLANLHQSDAQDPSKAKSWAAPMVKRGELTSAGGASERTSERLVDLLMGTEQVEKTDLLMLYFFVFCQVLWDEPIQELKERVSRFRNEADTLLKACGLPHFYIGHLVEATMLNAILAAGQEEDRRKKLNASENADPLSVYVYWLESLRSTDNDVKKETKLAKKRKKKTEAERNEAEAKRKAKEEEHAQIMAAKKEALSGFYHPTDFALAISRDETIRKAKEQYTGDERDLFFRKSYDISYNTYNVEWPKQLDNIAKVPNDYRRYLMEVWESYKEKYHVPQGTAEKLLGRQPDESLLLFLAEFFNYGRYAVKSRNLAGTAAAYGIGREQQLKREEAWIRKVEDGSFNRDAMDVRNKLTQEQEKLLAKIELAFYHWENPGEKRKKCFEKNMDCLKGHDEFIYTDAIWWTVGVLDSHRDQLEKAIDDFDKKEIPLGSTAKRALPADSDKKEEPKEKTDREKFLDGLKAEMKDFLSVLVTLNYRCSHAALSWEDCALACGIKTAEEWYAIHQKVLEIVQYKVDHPDETWIDCKAACGCAPATEEQQAFEQFLDAVAYYDRYKPLGIRKSCLNFGIKGAAGDLLTERQKNLVKFLLLLNFFVRFSDNNFKFIHVGQELEDRQKAIGLRQEDLETWQKDLLMMLEIGRAADCVSGRDMNVIKKIAESAERLGYEQRTQRQDVMLRVLMVLLDTREGKNVELRQRAEAQVSTYGMEPLTEPEQDLLNLTCLLLDRSFWNAISLEAYLPQKQVVLFKDMKPKKLAELLRLLREDTVQ